jgi:hypothetical protein
MSKEIIKQTLNSFRENYKLIKEIDHYYYIKNHFLGCYTEMPKNDVEILYNKYVTTHNTILENEEIRIKSLTVHSIDESQKYLNQLTALNESKILLVKKHTGAYSIVPDINILIQATYYDGGKEDTLFAKCKDSIHNVRNEYMYKLYPKVCNEMIDELELKVFTFLTSISKEEIMGKINQKNNLQVVKLQELYKAINEFITV